MTATITEDEFYEKYKPLHTEHGDLRMFDPRTEDLAERAAIDKAIAENRLWTMHHGEYDAIYFWSGPHFVNRLDYVICEVPFGEGEDILAEDPNHLPNWYCEWCNTEHDRVSRERYDALSEGIPCGAEGCSGDPDLMNDSCAVCGEEFTESSPGSRSRVDHTLCEFCYVNGEDV